MIRRNSSSRPCLQKIVKRTRNKNSPCTLKSSQPWTLQRWVVLLCKCGNARCPLRWFTVEARAAIKSSNVGKSRWCNGNNTASQPAVFCSSPSWIWWVCCLPHSNEAVWRALEMLTRRMRQEQHRPYLMKLTGNRRVCGTEPCLKFTSAKTLLSLISTEESPGFSMYIHDWKSLFNNCADLYQPRRFLLLGASELQNFKQTAGSHTSVLTFNYCVPSVLISGQAALLREYISRWVVV